jgi:hypothetical protein
MVPLRTINKIMTVPWARKQEWLALAGELFGAWESSEAWESFAAWGQGRVRAGQIKKPTVLVHFPFTFDFSGFNRELGRQRNFGTREKYSCISICPRICETRQVDKLSNKFYLNQLSIIFSALYRKNEFTFSSLGPFCMCIDIVQLVKVIVKNRLFMLESRKTRLDLFWIRRSKYSGISAKVPQN